VEKTKNKNGILTISIVELEKILEKAKNSVLHDNMESNLELKCVNQKINITQYCSYADCNAIYHVR
jgi:hypothetical protein